MDIIARARRLPVMAALLFIVSGTVFAQSGLLQSGPMVGYSEMNEVLLWVQTTAPATVKFLYRAKDEPSKTYATDEVTTRKEEAFTARLKADSLRPGTRYEYELWIDSKNVERPYPLEFQTQRLWQWREEPPPFSIAVGSCAYINEDGYDRPGTPYGGGYEIFTSIYDKHPDAMLWLGDNTYLREADWGTASGILHRYTHTRSLPELQPLLGSAHNYAIWDDHDFGPNDADRGFRGREASLQAFKLFWGNPTYGSDRLTGTATSFQWADVEFFLLDNRTFRSPDHRRTGTRQLLGDDQIEWLIDKLVSSTATFKIVAIGGQVLNPVDKFENYAIFPEERRKLLAALDSEKVSGVFFLSGDRHHSELTRLDRPGTYPLYDLTVSPLTSTAYNNESEANTLRVPGTYIHQRNFAILEFSGPYKERNMKITLFDTNGALLWSRTVGIQDLQ